MTEAPFAPHLRPLAALLERHVAAAPEDAPAAARFAALMRAREDCLLRSCEIGHVTASALVLSSDLERCLLTHHRKLGRWLQLGGHVDGEARVHLAALREANEESGLQRLAFLGHDGAACDPLPVDLDVHPIPAHGLEPRHEHHDVRFALVATGDEEVVVSDESLALRWFEVEAVAGSGFEPSLARLARRVLAIRDRR
jgi:8-oxo-dGTP pyrophosphatase MutT (NUDIX family)